MSSYDDDLKKNTNPNVKCVSVNVHPQIKSKKSCFKDVCDAFVTK